MKYFLLAGTALSVCWIPNLAAAQIVNPNPSIVDDAFRLQYDGRARNESVRERVRPDYDPVGVRFNAFTFRPALDFDALSTDNVLHVRTGAQSTTGLTVRPRFRLNSNWANHNLDIYGGLAHTELADFKRESGTDYEVGANGRFDIQRGTNLQARFRIYDAREERGSSGTPTNAIEPVRFNQANFTFGGIWELTRTRLSGRVDVSKLNYDDVEVIGGGIADQDNRDRTQTDLTLRADYAMSPAFALFAQVGANKRDYRLLSAPGVTRDSEGSSALFGANFDISNLARGEIGIGYLSQNYDEVSFRDPRGFGYRAAVEWFPSQKFTLAIAGTSSIDDSAVAGAGGVLTRGLGLQADYELLRNVILSAKATTQRADSRGIDRTDVRSNITFTGTYLLNRTAGVSLNLIRNEQTSSGAQSGVEFEENKVLVRLTLRR